MRQRIGRRLISIMLSVLMLVSLLPTAVFAEELPDQSTAGGTEQVGEGTVNTVKNSEETKGASSMPYVAKVGDNEYATLGEAIAAAEDKGTIILNAESYDGAELSSLSNTNKAVTIKAAEGVTPTFDMPKEYGKYVAIHNATVTFEGITFKYGNADYVGLAHAADLTYNSCTIEGKVFLYAKSETFNNCTFNQTISDYNVWTYGAMNVEFNGCIFNNAGKTVNVYIEKGNASAEVKSIKAEDCTVNSSADDKAFLNIKNASQSYDVTFTGTNTVKIDGAEGAGKLYQVQQTAYSEDNKTTLTVKEEKNGVLETVYEVKAPVVNYIDLDTFIKWLEDSNYSVDGASYTTTNKDAVVNGKLVVKWSPVSGCYDTREGHTCTAGGAIATGNTPKRVNSGLTQFQLFEGENVNVTVKNVKFVYEPADFTVCENSGWKGSFTVAQAPAGQLYFMTKGDVNFEACTFDKVVLTSFNTTGSTTVKDCSFADVYNNYAIKDIRGANVSVTGTTITNCGGGIMVSSTGDVKNVTISGNTFTKVDVADTAAEDKVGSRGLIQVASSGNYAGAAYGFSGNTAINCGPVLRQLNESVKLDKTDTENLKQLGNTLYTSDSKQAATVDGVVYPTLELAFAALNKNNYKTLEITDGAWTKDVVYWAAGTQSGYAAKLTDALTAAYRANAGDITIVCRPGADVGTMTHGHVADNITIYGNDAYISGGECDLEVDTYKFSRTTGAQDTTNGEYLTKDITINAYELDNLGVWGQRNTNHTINVNLTDCDGKAIAGKENVQRVYISNNSGVTSSVNNITLKGCDFLTAKTAVYSNANGTIGVDGCSFTGTAIPVNINHDGDGAVTVVVKDGTFTNCGDKGDWKNFAAPIRFVNSGSGTMDTTVDSCTFEGTVGKNGDILIGDGRAGKVSNDLSLTVKNTDGWVQAQKPGRYDGNKVDSSKRVATEVDKDVGLTTSIKSAFIKDTTGTRNDPYTLEQLSEMTRDEYIAAQNRLGGTMYVTVGNYEYDTNGVLGNGVRNDTPGQTPDRSKLNSYAENGYLGEGNDGANGKNIVFVNGSITSNVYGYTSIDNIGTSLLLAVPAYTNVTFEGITFNNVMSFDYQLYTSPWSQLGELKFENCVFEGIIVGAIAAQELTFDGCRFEDYENSKSENNSNPTWIRPAYGNWTKDDNEGQGTGFRSLTKITFTNNTVTSTRPVKFERIAQWEMATTVTATGNTFTINKVQGDTDTKNVGMYFGANAKFDLVVDNNTAKGKTAGLYTAVYSAPNGKSYAGLPAGSTVKDANGNNIEKGVPALEWKSTKPLTLKTTEEVAQLTTTKGVVKFATLQEAINAATNGDTVTLLLDETVTTAISVTGKSITLDLSGKTLRSSSKNGITVAAGAGLTVEDSSADKTGKVVATGSYSNGIENAGTLTIESGSFEAVYGAVRALGGSTTTINGGTFSSSAGHYGMYYWANKVALSVTVKGGTFKNTVSTAMEKGKVTLTVNGGSFSNDLTEYCPAEYGTYLKDSGYYEYALESANVPGGYEVDANGNVTISTEAGLFWFAHQTNAKGKNFAGKTVTLANDIALTKAWTPIGDFASNKAFKGTFDGQNHTVSGVRVTKYSTNGVGFFAKTFTATIKNLTVEGKITAYGCNYVGGIVGHGYATITNCTFRGTITNNGGYQVGGIAGSGGFTIKDCAVYGDISAESWVGGIIGNAQDGGAFTNCYVEGTISANSAYAGASAAGIAAIPLYKTQKIGGCYSNTVVKCGGEEINAPIIGAYNEAGVTADTELFIYDNSWNKAKNPNVSYEIKDGETVIEGKDVSRDNNLVMLKDDLRYVTDLSKVRIMAGSAVTQAQVDALAAASIGTAKYISLTSAIEAAASGETVKLLKNVTENVEIAKEKNLTLDLNGCTLNGGTGTDKAALYNLGTIIIQDTSAAKTGTIRRDDNGTAGYYVIDNQGTMTIESGTVINNSGYKKANSTGSMVGSSLICNGDCDEGGTLTIKGGTFTQNNFIAIKNGALGVLHVTGGTITSNHSAIQNWYKADITGGEINGQLWTDAYITGESVGETTISGDAKFTGEIVMDITGSVAPTLAINGGNLNVTNWRITNAAATAGAKPAISGGTFDAPVKPEYCVPNHEPVKNSNGTYTVTHFNVAEIGDTEYETLQEAINAAEDGQKIYLLRDITVTDTVKFDKVGLSIAIDLQGHTITGDKCRALQVIDGNLVLSNDSYATMGEAVITSTGIATASSVIRVGDGDHRQAQSENMKSPELDIAAGVTVKAVCSYGITVFGYGEEKLTVNGNVISTATTNASYDGCAISTVGEDKTAANVTINGGTITAENTNAIYMPSGNLLVYSGAIVRGLTGIYAKSGNVQIKGAKIYGTGEAKGYSYHGNGGIPTGDALVLDSCGYPNGAPTVNFAGAENAYFESTNAKPIGSYATEGNTKVTGFVDKGTFNKAIDKDLLKDGYVCVYNGENNYGVATTENCVAKVGDIYYATLQDAIDAAQNGATVVLVKDVDLTKTVVVNKTITLDMNGKKLHNTNEIWNDGNWSLISACGGNLTITGNGTFAAKENDCYAVDVQDGAKLVIKDGTFVGNIHAVYVFEGTATIDGGTYSVQQKYPDESKAYEFVLNCYDANRANDTAKIIVNGGTFQNFDPMNNQAEGKGTSFVNAGVGVDYVDGKFTAKSGMIAQVVDADGKSVKAFDKLSDALAAAKAGQTVKLLNRVNDVKYVEVEANVTLDLNGHDLTGAKLLWVTGTILDSATKKGIVSATKYLLPTNNGYAPVYNSTTNGYSFFELSIYSVKTDTGVAFKLRNTADRAAAAKLMAGDSTNRRVKAIVTVSWVDAEAGKGTQTFEFPDAKMNKYLEDVVKNGFAVTLGGLDRISGKVTAQASFEICDETGANIYTLSGDTWTIKE